MAHVERECFPSSSHTGGDEQYTTYTILHPLPMREGLLEWRGTRTVRRRQAWEMPLLAHNRAKHDVKCHNHAKLNLPRSLTPNQH